MLWIYRILSILFFPLVALGTYFVVKEKGEALNLFDIIQTIVTYIWLISIPYYLIKTWNLKKRNSNEEVIDDINIQTHLLPKFFLVKELSIFNIAVSIFLYGVYIFVFIRDYLEGTITNEEWFGICFSLMLNGLYFASTIFISSKALKTYTLNQE